MTKSKLTDEIQVVGGWLYVKEQFQAVRLDDIYKVGWDKIATYDGAGIRNGHVYRLYVRTPNELVQLMTYDLSRADDCREDMTSVMKMIDEGKDARIG